MLQRVRDSAFPLFICLAIAAMVVTGLLYSRSFRGGTLIPLSMVEPSKRSQHEPCTQNMVHALGSITNSLYPEPAANCSSLVAGNSTEVIRIKKLLTRWKSPLTDEQFYGKLHDCTYVRNLFSDYYYVSDTEKFSSRIRHYNAHCSSTSCKIIACCLSASQCLLYSS